MTTATQEKISRPMIPASDLDRLASVMAREGVTGKPAELLAALLDRFEERQQDSTKTAQEVTSTVQWFTAQIDSLQARLNERDQQANYLAEQLAKQSASQTTKQPAKEGCPLDTPVSPPASPRSPRISSNSRGKVDSIIDALIAWNTAQEDHSRQVRVSIPLIKALGSLIEATYQPAIQEAMRERAAEIEELHSRFMIGTRHNRKTANKNAILQAIARDYMGVENWQEASYG